MSYQQVQNINQFIPHYVVKSDYLPNTRVVDGNNTQTAQLVLFPLFLASPIWRIEKEGKSFHPKTSRLSTQPLRLIQSVLNSESGSANRRAAFQ